MQSFLLFIHIAAGYIGLLAGFIALAVKTFDMKHTWHIQSGKIFFWCMTIVALSALPLSFYIKNMFLLLIAIFSAYLTHGGWRYATNRTGQMRTIDRLSIFLAITVSIGMLLYGIYMLISNNRQGITLLVFSGILLRYVFNEKRLFRHAPIKNDRRIATHLSHMLAAMIASVTAFVVTNITFEPAFILWLAPTIVLIPVIVYWNRKLLK